MNVANFISIEEAAQILNKSDSATRHFIEKGYISVQPESKPTRVSRDDVLSLKSRLDNKGKQSPYGKIQLAPNEYLKLWGLSGKTRQYTSQQYAVSNLGRVFNLSQCKELSPSLATHGYWQVTLALGQKGQQRYERVATMVGQLWCRNLLNKPELHHIDGNPRNNRASNLIWVTKEQHATLQAMITEILYNPYDKDLQDAYQIELEKIRIENYIKRKAGR